VTSSRERFTGGSSVTILVTGATGRVGTRFVPRLLRQGHHHVRLLVRDPARAKSLEDLGAELAAGDVQDQSSVDNALAGVDAVVNVAAAFRGATEEQMVAVNHIAAVELARSSMRAGAARFVQVSTGLTYGFGRPRPTVETDELAQGDHTYPATKAAAEADLRKLHQEEGLPLRVARLGFVYGDGDPHLAESLMWARSWPPHQRLHLVHHADVAQALTRLAVADGLDGAIVNVADDAPVTAWELLALNGEQPDDDAATRPLEDPWEGIFDTTRLRTLLGVRPIYPTVYAARDAGAL
jgi:nucleoside-diphosphate-sugar epimerase